MQTLYKLKARTIAGLKTPGRYSDGGNLYLTVGNGGRSWAFYYRDRASGRMREMGLGSAATVSLQDARQKAADARTMIDAGIDPLADRQAKRAIVTGAKTFGVYCDEFLDGATAGFKNAKHRAQWRTTLETYAKPLWPVALHAITTEDVRACLEPIWNTKHETARRVRGRIERVLSAAKAAGLRDGANPAAWKDNLQPFFGKQRKAKRHHPALPYKELPRLMVELRERDSISASALEFVILTAVRSNEAREMRWREIDFDEEIWTIPAERMKMAKEHRVPLTDAAIAILKKRKTTRNKPNGLVFPGAEQGAPLSDMALLEALRQLRQVVTVHGMRSSFRDWAGDETNFPRELAEAALAHKEGDDTEVAYRRSDALERRRELMQAWADYLA